ncbi:winged helix family two component transcriptional regulator [Fictibacillus macauensis ZFHKF-1]|uniref:Heme response regulator HssR n=1 Tax=Fictibacillus macauensis ZFHKF-1 TaxID=1196324 RepID=I8AGQ9_9BACL|nr:response regulator transcription factor [Fictibacillus macauensis]EIT84867.1 winged helix family two component transcriptional regulator [Fictibacillus macauensis ZFHKF-1]
MIQVLVADDDPHIRELLTFHLQEAGYGVQTACDGEEAMTLLMEGSIELAVVDIMMPKKDGYALCQEIRSVYDVPIILLTAKDELVHKEKGFAVGTDDYMTKPFEIKELLFRMKALLRRYQKVAETKLIIGDTTIDRRRFDVRIGDKQLLLPRKEFQLLFQLASYPGRIFTRDELIQCVWGVDYEGDDRTVDVHIKRLRERFSAKTSAFTILTVRGVGYKLQEGSL